MRKIFKIGALAAVVAAFAVSVLGVQSAKAIVGGMNATQQYGAASVWTPPANGDPNRHRCHVNVISQYWGVTAAHCIYNQTIVAGVSQVRASGVDIVEPFSPQNPDGYKESVGVAATFEHPNYVPDQGNYAGQNDIGLVKFASPIKKTAPLALPSTSSPVGTAAKLAGWGWICDSDISLPNCGITPRFSPILKELTVKIVDQNECTYPHNTSQMFCIKAAANVNEMACVGDSGAPVTRKGFDRLILTGVTIGDGDLETDHPGFCGGNIDGGQGTSTVTDVAVYTPWIHDTIFAHGGSSAAQMPKFVNANVGVRL